MLSAILLLTLGVGVDSASAADPAPPSVSQVSPDSSPTYGGQTVIVYFSANLSYYPDEQVLFGGATATLLGMAGPNSIEVETPPHARGTVNVQLKDSGGTSPVIAGSSFVYFQIPTVSSVSPGTGPAAGGNTVTLTGAGFTGATEVDFGGYAGYNGMSNTHVGGASAPSFTVLNDNQLTAVAPPGVVTGFGVSVYVTTASGGSSDGTGNGGYEYVPAPTVTGVNPSFGPAVGGTTVDVNGTSFLGGVSAVDFGGTPATNIAVVSDTELTVTAPPGDSTVDVTVEGAGGPSAVNPADEFRYDPLPVVTSVSPSAGPESGGTTVTISGTGFSDATAVTIGATAALNFTVISDTQIFATVPAGTGINDVSVTGPDGTSVTVAADEFTYLPQPTVTTVSPTSGPQSGGTSVTISGAGFTAATLVDFGGIPASSFTTVDDTEITATSPPGTGTVDITVTAPGGTSTTTAADQFTYLAPVLPPTISSLSPAIGAVGGGTIVTIAGSGFGGTTGVTFGGLPVARFTVNSASSITVTTPAGSTGPANVIVSSAGGSSTAAIFTFTAAPSQPSVPVLGATGSTSPLPMFLAALLLLASGVAVMASRRIRRRRLR